MLRKLRDQNKNIGRQGYREVANCLMSELPKYGERFKIGLSDYGILLTVNRKLNDKAMEKYRETIERVLEQNGLDVKVVSGTATPFGTTEFVM